MTELCREIPPMPSGSYLNRDQYEAVACRCILPAEHDGDHECGCPDGKWTARRKPPTPAVSDHGLAGSMRHAMGDCPPECPAVAGRCSDCPHECAAACFRALCATARGVCDAWDGCPLPAGHNMGQVDIPENHAPPRDLRTALVRWVETRLTYDHFKHWSDEEVADDLLRHVFGRP